MVKPDLRARQFHCGPMRVQSLDYTQARRMATAPSPARAVSVEPSLKASKPVFRNGDDDWADHPRSHLVRRQRP